MLLGVPNYDCCMLYLAMSVVGGTLLRVLLALVVTSVLDFACFECCLL